MKVILSRKGFDSETGGYASPIMPDGTMLSLPIPDNSTKMKYKDLEYNNKNYKEIMNSLNGEVLKEDGNKIRLDNDTTCHLDPDLRKKVIKRQENWRGLYGQINGSQTHLENQEVKEGDLFLFFGWFRKTIIVDGKLKFDPKDKNGRHIIYGYLQIDKIIKLDNEKKLENWMKYHPHALNSRLCRNKNTLYVAKKKLTFMEEMPGYGTFKYDKHCVLTKDNQENRSYWNLPKDFKKIKISYHTEKNWIDDYFKSNARGQEFVIQEHKVVKNWIAEIFDKNSKQWGLRGDPHLWNDLKEYFEQRPFVNNIDEFEIELIKAFKLKTGKSIFDEGIIYIKKYAKGGMSSGQINIDTWRNRYIPNIIKEHKIKE